MPAISERLREMSGKLPDRSQSADEAVACGAALHAANLLLGKNRGSSRSFYLKNINSHSLGVVGIDKHTKRQRNGILIPRNTQLPVTAKRGFKLLEAGQQSISVQIIEGEGSSPDDCTQIGKCVIRNLPPELPAGTPIEVRFHYEANGRLIVSVRVSGTDRFEERELVRENSMTKHQLNQWRKYISGQ